MPPTSNNALLSVPAAVAISSFFLGAAVPMPTLFVEKSYTNPLVSMASPPAIVEVAVVLVAAKLGNVKAP